MIKYCFPLILFPYLAFSQSWVVSKAIRPSQNIECGDHDSEKSELKRALFIADSLGISERYTVFDKAIAKYSWPLKWLNQSPGNSFFSISNYFENDPADLVRDFNCGNRSYNGHKGTDIYPWPGWWLAMDNEEIDVVAGAGGRIINKFDGNFDRNCVWGNQSWNAIYLQHPGGSVSWYGHLKRNSLTSKAIGDSISEGEFLGKIGSSGRSTGPHLHFEVYHNGQLLDPYAGTCNPGQTSLWKNQFPYYNQALIRSFCTSGDPVFPPCPQVENLKKDSIYLEGDSIYLTNYYRDLKNGDTTILLLRNPSGILIDSLFTIHDISPNTFFDAGGWIWKRKLDSNSIGGLYSFQSRYRGNILKANFNYLVPLKTNILQKPSIKIWQEKQYICLEGLIPGQSISVFDILGRKIPVSIQSQNNVLKLDNIKITGYYFVNIDGKQNLPFSFHPF